MITVLGTVQGLASEESRVREAFAAARPGALALGVSAESVAGLMALKPGEYHLLPIADEDGTYDAAELLTDAEVAYGLALQQFGKVLLPPRDLIAAVELSRAHGVPVFGVDFTEEGYGEVFAKHVSAWALLRYTRRSRKLEKRPPKAADARDFALKWDAELRRVKGYDAVEKAREERMAEAAAALAREHGSVLLVVEAAREDGVRAILKSFASTGAASSNS